jgi:uncharacterized membrane protein YkgB
MSDRPSIQATISNRHDLFSSNLSSQSRSILIRLSTWIGDHRLPFLIVNVGMIVMLLWAGAYKMTAPGAEGIIPLVSNSPLIWWHFKVFGPYIGSDIIGLTEIAAASLLIVGHLRPKAGVIGGMIATLMFFTTSTMFITTPGTLISVVGIPAMKYMSLLGLFLFKDVISLGASLYLICHYGQEAILHENRR